MSTHRIAGCEAIDRGEQDTPLAFRLVQYSTRPIGWADVAIHLPALACVALCLAPPVITFIIIGALSQ